MEDKVKTITTKIVLEGEEEYVAALEKINTLLIAINGHFEHMDKKLARIGERLSAFAQAAAAID